MNLTKLLKRGYFPKELPPPFDTSKFASKLRSIISRSASYASSPSESKTVKFSLPKGKFSRRKLEIPQPKQYLELCQYIINNWTTINSHYSLSTYSASTPVPSKSNRALRTKSKSLNEFRFGLLNKAFDRTHELKLDISQFYPTIYTHSITWALMGRHDAKLYFKKKNKPGWSALIRTDPKASLYVICDKLDMLVRNCQERQSVGIPIGPDTSFIIAELIGSRLDFEIWSQIGSDVHCSRYYDDYYFYLNSRAEAERILKTSQKILNEYKLEINESKISIIEAPFSLEYEWANILTSYRFRKNDVFELRTFFDEVFRLIDRFASDSSQIIHYALQRFEYGNVPIKKESWSTFLLLTLHLQSSDATNLNQFLKILLSYKTFWSKSTRQSIRTTLEKIIERHILLNHSFEVSWSLWIMISLGIKCKSELLTAVLDSNDPVSKIVCLDLIDRKLYEGRRPPTAHIFRTFAQDDLYGESWLFVYESIVKGWLARASTRFLAVDPFINSLHLSGVEFYLRDNQLSPEFIFNPISGKPEKPLTRKQKTELLHLAADGPSKY